MILPLTEEQSASLKEDEKLCKKILEGDTDSFSLLAEKYRRRIFSLGMGFFKNSEDTEDFLQEVLVKVYLSLKKFRGESRFSTWLTRIAYNTAINSMKRRKNYISLAEVQENVPGFDGNAGLDFFTGTTRNETPEDVAVKKATISAIREAVRNLPEPYRICIDFFFFYDMSYKEISETAGIPLNTIRSHIFRAKKILRKYLDETDTGEIDE